MGLLVCGHVHPAAQSIGGDYPELFDALFAPLGVEVIAYSVDQGCLPATIQECDGWVTSPSRNSVNDGEPWIAGLEAFVGELVRAEHPFAGICFGHQLLARALGGSVSRAPGGWGVGVQRYDVVEHRWWMDPPPTNAGFRLVASHEDQVTALPPGGVVLASSASCPVAAFEVGDRAIGLQPHPEFDGEISARLLDLRADIIGADIVTAARDTLSEVPDRELVARWIVRFLRGR